LGTGGSIKCVADWGGGFWAGADCAGAAVEPTANAAEQIRIEIQRIHTLQSLGYTATDPLLACGGPSLVGHWRGGKGSWDSLLRSQAQSTLEAACSERSMFVSENVR